MEGIKKSFYNYTLSELKKEFSNIGLKSFIAEQVFE
jgi:adenine C2-methylase RlmN of 23S rRNA A2503 and tRNA A37